ncbi:hypothetical protein DN539_31000, partial [Burkholderia multivorans]
ATEVLGFTTGAWNGGRVPTIPAARGKPRHPGRLNEACHLVFKDAATRWRHARRRAVQAQPPRRRSLRGTGRPRRSARAWRRSRSRSVLS